MCLACFSCPPDQVLYWAEGKYLKALAKPEAKPKYKDWKDQTKTSTTVWVDVFIYFLNVSFYFFHCFKYVLQ